MTDETHARIVEPPNTLKAKIGGKMPALTPDMLARAEASLKALSGQFASWMNEELKKLNSAYNTIKTDGLAGESGAQFYRAAHDLKGLGTTYEFPVVSRLAASLCKLLDDEDQRPNVPAALVKAHVDAINAAVREQAKGDGTSLSAALSEELEKQVAVFTPKNAA